MSCQITYLIINLFSNFTPTFIYNEKRGNNGAHSEETELLKRLIYYQNRILAARN